LQGAITKSTGQSPAKKTYAQAVTSTATATSAATTTTAGTTTKKKRLEPKPQAISKVVLTAENTPTIVTIDGKAVRDQFNKALNGNVVARVEISKRNNIVITTTKFYTADQFLEVQNEWWPVVQENWPEIQKAEKPTTWNKLVVHGIPVEEASDGFEKFKTECKEYNKIQVIGKSRWLIPPSEDQKKASIVFSVESEQEKKACLKNGLDILGIGLKVVNYRPYSTTTQCNRCQSFGHNPTTCRLTIACRLCAKPHYTKQHYCKECKKHGECNHLVAKCANCSQNHLADHPHCEAVKAVGLSY